MKYKIFKCLLTALLFCSISAYMPAKALGVDSFIRIGLAFGTDALPAANLQNVSGMSKGYSFGYFDKASDSFVSLYESGEAELTMLKDKPMYLGSGKTYYDSRPASFTAQIGSYHLETSKVFYSIDEVNAACKDMELHGYMAFPAYFKGSYKMRVGAYMTSAEAKSDSDYVAVAAGDSVSVCGQSSTCYTVTKTSTDKIIFEFDNGGTTFAVMPKSSQTWSKGYKYYGGFEYNRIDGNNLTVINVVKMNDYLKGVVPYEMSASWPIEALKAQALCAKSYCLNNAGRHSSQGFDICNTTHCQVYYGTNSANSNSDKAVDQTEFELITYGGKAAQTYYHSSSGGWTENSENIWGGYVPYLRAVEDKYLTHLTPWKYEISADTVAKILNSKGTGVDTVTDMYISKLTDAGNVRELTICRNNGSPLVYSGEKARTILNSTSYNVSMKSHRFSVFAEGQASQETSDIYVNGEAISGKLGEKYAIGSGGTPTAISSSQENYAISSSGVSKLAEGSASSNGALKFTINGTGNGHHVGMSQWGAYDMAQKGFSYIDIIKFYFTGVQVG